MPDRVPSVLRSRTGGGVVFAPVPRDYSFKMNKKEKAAAMKSVLSSKVNEENLSL